MSLTLGTTLKTVEKLFGPALAGRGDEVHTVSATRFAAGKGKKFAGVPGFHPEASFYIHFPVPVDFSKIKSKAGVVDHIKDLTEDGPQSRQGRQDDVDVFLKAYTEKATLAEAKAKGAAEKKAKAEAAKAEKIRLLDEKASKFQKEKAVAEYLAQHRSVTFTVDGHAITAQITITASKKGTRKVKLSAEFVLS